MRDKVSDICLPDRLVMFLPPALVVVGFTGLMIRTGMTVDTPPPWPRWSFVDFRDTVWVPSRDLFAGRDPYDLPAYLARHPASQEFSLYAPALLVAAAPIAALPWPVAMVVWGVLLLVAFVVLIRRAAVLAGASPAGRWIGAALAVLLLSPPGNQPAASGQYAVVAAAAVVVALSSDSTWVTAVATALALVKPQVGLPLLVLLLVQRRWRAALAGAGLAALVSAPAVVALTVRAGGPGAWFGVLRHNITLTESSPNTEAARAGSTRIDVLGALQRLGEQPDGLWVGLLTVLTAAVTIGVAALCWEAMRRRPQTDRTVVAWWVAVAGVMVLWTPSELYAFLIAVPAVLRALLGAARAASSGAWPGWPLVPGLLLTLPFLHVHRVDAVLRIDAYTQGLNCLTIVLAVLLAAVTVRGRIGSELDPRVG